MQRIAADMGITYPKDRNSGDPCVLTTDFLINIQDNGKNYQGARTIKPSTQLSQIRTIEKYELERLYWQAQNTDWGIVTEKDISQDFAANIEWLHPFKKLEAESKDYLFQLLRIAEDHLD